VSVTPWRPPSCAILRWICEALPKRYICFSRTRSSAPGTRRPCRCRLRTWFLWRTRCWLARSLHRPSALRGTCQRNPPRSRSRRTARRRTRSELRAVQLEVGRCTRLPCCLARCTRRRGAAFVAVESFGTDEVVVEPSVTRLARARKSDAFARIADSRCAPQSVHARLADGRKRPATGQAARRVREARQADAAHEQLLRARRVQRHATIGDQGEACAVPTGLERRAFRHRVARAVAGSSLLAPTTIGVLGVVGAVQTLALAGDRARRAHRKASGRQAFGRMPMRASSQGCRAHVSAQATRSSTVCNEPSAK